MCACECGWASETQTDSAVCSPVVLSRGKVVASTDETEGIVYGEVDMSEVDRVRTQIPITVQKRWDLYSSITDKSQQTTS